MVDDVRVLRAFSPSPGPNPRLKAPLPPKKDRHISIVVSEGEREALERSILTVTS